VKNPLKASLLVIYSLAFVLLTSCRSGSGAAPHVTPDQIITVAKLGAHFAGETYINQHCKDGLFAGVPCDEAAAQLAATIDTLAADAQPGGVVDPASREATRHAAATQFARSLHPEDFAGTDDAAKERQARDIAAVRPIVNVIGDAFLLALGK